MALFSGRLAAVVVKHLNAAVPQVSTTNIIDSMKSFFDMSSCRSSRLNGILNNI